MLGDIEKEALPAWGVDVGGTRCKVGVVDRRGAVRAQRQIATLRDPEAMVEAIALACREVAAQAGGPIARLGMGAPGPLRFEEGVVVHAPNLGWREVPLRAMVADAVGCPVVLDNDATQHHSSSACCADRPGCCEDKAACCTARPASEGTVTTGDQSSACVCSV